MTSELDPSLIDPLAPLPVPEVCVIGCGNLLRGDDAAGPFVIRKLWQLGVGHEVNLVDGGTAGMDVAFKMRGAKRVILIDACDGSGDPPGTLFRVPGDAIADVPPPKDIHSHAFRWDHSLSFAKWLLKDDYPDDIEVWLIEGESYTHGDDLTPAVQRTVDALAQRLADELSPDRVVSDEPPLYGPG